MKNKRDVKVRKRKDGLYEIRYSINGRQFSVYGSSVSVCRDKYGCIVDERKKQTRVKAMIFKTWFDNYINKYKKNVVKESTLKNLKGIFNNHILPYLGKKTLKQIKTEDIQITLNKMSNIPRQQTIAFVQLNACLNQAKDNRLIEYNPCDAVCIKKNNGEKGTALTPKEEDKLIDYIEKNNHKMKTLIYLYLSTGMRRCELLNIRFCDLDFEKNEITVNGTKTKNAKRRIQVPPQVMALFPKKDMPFEEWNKDMVNRQFRAICDELNLKHITLHSLRHTFATRCLENGVEMYVVSKWLGHSSIKLTMDTYAHVSDELKRSKVARVKYKFLP